MSNADTARVQQVQQIRDILIDVLEIAPAELTEHSDFVNDHGADSLMAIDIISGIERDLGVRIPNEALPDMVDLAAAIELVDKYGSSDA